VALGWSATVAAANAQVTETVLYSFPDTGYPYFDYAGNAPPLIADIDAKTGAARALYGVTQWEGSLNCRFGCGTAFKLAAPKPGHAVWKDTLLWQFTGGADGSYPGSAMVAQSKHISRTTPLYGTTPQGNGTVYSLVGTTLTTIYAFTGGADGGTPGNANVLTDASGALYVALQAGGTGAFGCGTIDKLTPPGVGETNWTETTIWTFNRMASDIGCAPTGLAMDKSGTIYGVTQYGGPPPGFNGNVFRLVPPQNGGTIWQERNLYNFTAAQNNSSQYSNLTIGRNGVLYGTESGNYGSSHGLVFAVTPPHGKAGWTGQIIWTFTGGNDGDLPLDSVLVDRNGAVYGTAEIGGSGAGGTVYKLTKPPRGQTAWTETTLWSFSFPNDILGSYPEGLVADKAGTLYGITGFGGSTYGEGCNGDYGCGTVYSLTGTGFAP
jgi:hypothetical protein